MIKDLYPTPAEARQRRRVRAAGSSGTGFYKARGLPFVTMRELRAKRRDPDANTAVELSRELTKLANDFPRFRLALNRLQHHVLIQVRSPGWKQKAILKVLDQDKAQSIREVVQRSGLDFVSVTKTLEGLKDGGKVIACNRAGRPLEVTHTIQARYWRRRG